MKCFENATDLEEAISFLMRYNCCFGWNAFASNKAPCCNYSEVDKDIPETLRQAIWGYLRSLTKEKRRDLNRQFSLLLGERFYVRERVIVKILSRILSEGDPRQDKEMITFALQMQIKQRMDLLEALKVN